MPSKSADMATYMRDRRAARRARLLELGGGKCRECSSNEELEFNHRDRSLKSFALSGGPLDRSWESLVDELLKCDILCKKCHLKYTATQWKEGEIRPWNDRKDIPQEHGSARCYFETKCKCDLCKKARTLYRKKEISYRQCLVT